MSVGRPHERPLLRRALIGCALAVLLALAAAPRAHAETTGEKIILRCTHGQSLAGFSQAAYRQALEELAADTEEYSECGLAIRQAEAAAAAHTARAGASAGQLPGALQATPGELSSLASAKRTSSPVSVDGQLLHPGVVHADISSALSALPAPLLAVLALMVACALALAAVLLRKRVRDRRSG